MKEFERVKGEREEREKEMNDDGGTYSPVKGFKFHVRPSQMLDLDILSRVVRFRLIDLLQLLQAVAILDGRVDPVEPSLKLIRRPNRNSPTLGVI